MVLFEVYEFGADKFVLDYSFTRGGYIEWHDGSFVEFKDTWSYTDYIPITPNETLQFVQDMTRETFYNAFYDKDKNYINYFYVNKGTVDIPPDAAYMRLSKPTSARLTVSYVTNVDVSTLLELGRDKIISIEQSTKNEILRKQFAGGYTRQEECIPQPIRLRIEYAQETHTGAIRVGSKVTARVDRRWKLDCIVLSHTLSVTSFPMVGVIELQSVNLPFWYAQKSYFSGNGDKTLAESDVQNYGRITCNSPSIQISDVGTLFCPYSGTWQYDTVTCEFLDSEDDGIGNFRNVQYGTNVTPSYFYGDTGYNYTLNGYTEFIPLRRYVFT